MMLAAPPDTDRRRIGGESVTMPSPRGVLESGEVLFVEGVESSSCNTFKGVVKDLGEIEDGE